MQTDARLRGAELSLDARVSDMLTLRGSYDFVRGDDRTNNVPLPLMPPPRTILGAKFFLGNKAGVQNVSLGGDVELNATQDRLNPLDYGTQGYTLLNFDVSFEHPTRWTPAKYDILVRNALNTSYRDFLSRYKTFASGPGVNVIVKASIGAW
jgi:iron complex outermembrane receptor protein